MAPDHLQFDDHRPKRKDRDGFREPNRIQLTTCRSSLQGCHSVKFLAPVTGENDRSTPRGDCNLRGEIVKLSLSLADRGVLAITK